MQNKNSDITLFGAGGHCKVVIDILKSNGFLANRVVDDAPHSSVFMQLPLGKPEDAVYQDAIITIGNCAIRKKIVERIKTSKYLTIIHPSAILCDNVTIGEGTVIVHGAIVQSGASIGNHCIINTKSSIDHDTILHDFVHVAPGATICGECEVGECTWIGAGSVVKQGIKIGKNCMIGAGSVVVSNIPDGVVAYGNPCKVRRLNQ